MPSARFHRHRLSQLVSGVIEAHPRHPATFYSDLTDAGWQHLIPRVSKWRRRELDDCHPAQQRPTTSGRTGHRYPEINLIKIIVPTPPLADATALNSRVITARIIRRRTYQGRGGPKWRWLSRKWTKLLE
jgi:hypothetical protein